MTVINKPFHDNYILGVFFFFFFLLLLRKDRERKEGDDLEMAYPKKFSNSSLMRNRNYKQWCLVEVHSCRVEEREKQVAKNGKEYKVFWCAIEDQTVWSQYKKLNNICSICKKKDNPILNLHLLEHCHIKIFQQWYGIEG